MGSNDYHRIWSLAFFRAFLIHMRPYLLYVSGVAGLSGMAIAADGTLELRVFLLAFIPFFLAYGFGQALTDSFQIDTDSLSAPYRPLVKKEISPRDIRLISFVGLILLSTSIIYLNIYNLIWGALCVLGLATYTHFKRNFWYLGPFYNAWIVMLLPIMGFMAVSQTGLKELFNRNLLILMVLSFFSYANFVLIGYLKDISADRETGYKTFPVLYGWERTVWVGDIFAVISIVACYFLIKGNRAVPNILFLMGCAIAVTGQLIGHLTKHKKESRASFLITSTVRSFILWHLAVTVHARPEWTVFAILFFCAFEVTLYFRPAKEQI